MCTERANPGSRYSRGSVIARFPSRPWISQMRLEIYRVHCRSRCCHQCQAGSIVLQLIRRRRKQQDTLKFRLQLPSVEDDPVQFPVRHADRLRDSRRGVGRRRKNNDASGNRKVTLFHKRQNRAREPVGTCNALFAYLTSLLPPKNQLPGPPVTC